MVEIDSPTDRASRPILVTGAHRSGTTWVGRTISRHPVVHYVQEPFNVSYPNDSMNLSLDTWFTHFDSSPRQQEIANAFDRLLPRGRMGHAWEACRLAGLDSRTPLRFIKYLLSSQRVLVKDPIALFSAGWLYETYHFQVVCMIRNPLAFAGSLKVAGWDFDFEDLRRQQGLMEGPLRAFAEDITRSCEQRESQDLIDRAALLWNVLHHAILGYRERYPDWLFVRHEDLAASPVAEYEKIFVYLGLDMQGSIREYIENYSSQRNPKNASSNVYQPRDSKQVLETWRERLTEEEVARIRRATSAIADQFYATGT